MKSNRMIALALSAVTSLLFIFPAPIHAADAARVAGDLKVGGIHFTTDNSVIRKLSDLSSFWTYLDPNIYYLDGNVGIGTMNPSQRLSVTGTIESTTGGFKFPDGTTMTTAGSFILKSGDTMTGSLSISSGNLTLPATSPGGGIIYLGGSPFIHGFGTYNFFAGSGAGNFTMTGQYNTASGSGTLAANTTGSFNTASGVGALSSNTGGNWNTANGSNVLRSNTIGVSNTASGTQALYSNTEGNRNTALGYQAGYTQNIANANTTGSSNTFIGAYSGPGTATQLTNATAIGANALVSASNSLVLGGTGTSAVKVGIGTEAPSESLDVLGNQKVSGTVMAGTVQANSLIATVPTGIPPLQVSSTTQVTNLNAEMVGGKTLAGLDSRYTDPTSPVPSVQQIATLRWDQVRGGSVTTTVGTGPRALAFDGSGLWVANFSSNSVMKVNPVTGVAGLPIPVGTGPRALSFDGGSIWVANYSSNTVMKINPATGAVGSPIDVGTGPQALAFDGSNLWVANYGSNSVMKINPATGDVSPPITGFFGPCALSFDGSSIWVANISNNTVMKINPSTGVVGPPITVGTAPRSLVFDGSSIWVANWNNNIMKIIPATGVVSQTINVGGIPEALAFDGISIWMANLSNNGVMKINPTTGEVGPSITVGTGPQSLAFDGSNIWVANYVSNTIMKLVAVGQPVGIQTVGTAQMNDTAVTSTKIADGAITTAKIADFQVNTSKIASNAVTTTRIADGAVTAAKIADGTITAAKLDTAYVNRGGDTMTGTLNLPPTGVRIGNSYGAITESWWEFGKDDGLTSTGIDFHGANTSTDYAARIARTMGDNGEFRIQNHGTGPLRFYANSATPHLTILGDGNVGIGTTSPSDKLSVVGNISANGVRFSDNTVQMSAAVPAAYQQVPKVTTITTIDSGGNVGIHSSIIVGSDGLPVISYFDATNSDLKIAKCGTPACSSGNSIHAIDSTGVVGQNSSIAIGSDGYPVISYYDGTNKTLKIVKCGNLDCSAGNTLRSLVNMGAVSGHTSIAIGSDGFPVIAIPVPDQGILEVVKCGDISCSWSSVFTVDDSVTVEGDISMAIGYDGLPIIAYSYSTANAYGLKVAKCGNTACSSVYNRRIIYEAIFDVGHFNFITIDNSGMPVISYYAGQPNGLNVARCNDPACLPTVSFSNYQIESFIGQFTSITIGSDGLPFISFYGTITAPSTLAVVKCLSESCEKYTQPYVLDASANVGQDTSTTIGSDGLPVISYYDVTNGNLKVAKCANQYCRNNWTRR